MLLRLLAVFAIVTVASANSVMAAADLTLARLFSSGVVAFDERPDEPFAAVLADVCAAVDSAT